MALKITGRLRLIYGCLQILATETHWETSRNSPLGFPTTTHLLNPPCFKTPLSSHLRGQPLSKARFLPRAHMACPISLAKVPNAVGRLPRFTLCLLQRRIVSLALSLSTMGYTQ